MPTPELPVDVARWLVGPGAAVVDVATAALDEGEDDLAVGSGLRRQHPPELAAAAVAAAAARRRARAQGLPDADRLLFTRGALEQGSRAEVAAHRAARFAGTGPVVDLCAGAGIDALALATTGARVIGVELDPSRCLLLAHNAGAVGADVAAVVGDAGLPPVRTDGRVHADPSRRRAARRARSLAEYGPPVPRLLAATADARGRGVVVSPAVAWDDPGLPRDGEVEFLQVGPDLVEAMLWTGELRRPGARATATLLPSGDSRSVSDTTADVPVGPVADWLVEVAPAAVRARAHAGIARELAAHRLARVRALLTTAVRPPPSPWWIARMVEAVLPPRERTVRRWLREATPPLPLEIAVHGVAADPAVWWRALGRPERGPQGRRLHLVRTDDGAICIATRIT